MFHGSTGRLARQPPACLPAGKYRFDIHHLRTGTLACRNDRSSGHQQELAVLIVPISLREIPD